MLFLVVGPSGAGKDSLINYCRDRLRSSSRFHFPQRMITRSAGDVTETHRPIERDAFERGAMGGAFALHWEAHGLGYAIDADITCHLAAGRSVVVNVSRSVVVEALRQFAPGYVIHVTARSEILAARLARRGREAPGDAADRLARQAVIPVAKDQIVTLRNESDIASAGEAMLRAIEARQQQQWLPAVWSSGHVR